MGLKPRATSAPITTTVTIKGTGPSGSWTYFEAPFDVPTVFGTRARVPVVGTINGAAFRSTLSPMGGGKHIMPLRKELRAAAAIAVGDSARLVIRRDTQPRVVTVPVDMKKMIGASKKLSAFWDKLSYTHQKEYVQWIEEAKRPETRARRIAKAKTMLADGIRSK
jgi:hypothetical protein